MVSAVIQYILQWIKGLKQGHLKALPRPDLMINPCAIVMARPK
jgi:hypothetical protein